MSSEREIEHESHEWDGGKEVRGRHSKVEACLPQDEEKLCLDVCITAAFLNIDIFISSVYMELIRRPFDSVKPDDADYHFMAVCRKFSGPVSDRGISIMH